MRDALWPGTTLGYCTNVHAGTTLDEVKANLQRHALAAKARVSPSEPMGIGLWLAADAAQSLIDDEGVEHFRDWLDDRGLNVFTINGFPYGNFHEPVVKHKVYKPDWCKSLRRKYTINLARILAVLLGEQSEGSISTLPIGWGRYVKEEFEEACNNLDATAQVLERIESQTGKMIHVDLEPEPGCCLGSLRDAAMYSQRGLLNSRNTERIRRYIRICVDTCHAAVMHDDLAESLDRFDQLGIAVGKVQVSNAPRLDLRHLADRERTDAIAELRAFSENRYLHQTTVSDNGDLRFFEDLPDALRSFHETDRGGDEWRIHYHVPIYLSRFGTIGTTQESIIECLKLLRNRDVAHWEIETYAWNVLPADLQHDTLAAGIAEEFHWLLAQAEQLR